MQVAGGGHSCNVDSRPKTWLGEPSSMGIKATMKRTWRPSGLRISRVIIRVTPFRVLRTLLITHLPSPLGLQVGGRERSCQRRRLRRGFCKSSWFDRQSIAEPRKSAGHPPCKRHFSAARMADDRFRKRVLRLCKRAERSISWIPRCSPHRSGRDLEGL